MGGSNATPPPRTRLCSHGPVGLRGKGSGVRGQGSGLRVKGSGLRVYGWALEFRVKEF